MDNNLQSFSPKDYRGFTLDSDKSLSSLTVSGTTLTRNTGISNSSTNISSENGSIIVNGKRVFELCFGSCSFDDTEPIGPGSSNLDWNVVFDNNIADITITSTPEVDVEKLVAGSVAPPGGLGNAIGSQVLSSMGSKLTGIMQMGPTPGEISFNLKMPSTEGQVGQQLIVSSITQADGLGENDPTNIMNMAWADGAGGETVGPLTIIGEENTSLLTVRAGPNNTSPKTVSGIYSNILSTAYTFSGLMALTESLGLNPGQTEGDTASDLAVQSTGRLFLNAFNNVDQNGNSTGNAEVLASAEAAVRILPGQLDDNSASNGFGAVDKFHLQITGNTADTITIASGKLDQADIGTPGKSVNPTGSIAIQSDKVSLQSQLEIGKTAPYTFPTETSSNASVNSILKLNGTALEWSEDEKMPVVTGGNEIEVSTTFEDVEGEPLTAYEISFNAEGKQVVVGGVIGTNGNDIDIEAAADQQLNLVSSGIGGVNFNTEKLSIQTIGESAIIGGYNKGGDQAFYGPFGVLHDQVSQGVSWNNATNAISMIAADGTTLSPFGDRHAILVGSNDTTEDNYLLYNCNDTAPTPGKILDNFQGQTIDYYYSVGQTPYILVGGYTTGSPRVIKVVKSEYLNGTMQQAVDLTVLGQNLTNNFAELYDMTWIDLGAGESRWYFGGVAKPNKKPLVFWNSSDSNYSLQDCDITSTVYGLTSRFGGNGDKLRSAPVLAVGNSYAKLSNDGNGTFDTLIGGPAAARKAIMIGIDDTSIMTVVAATSGYQIMLSSADGNTWSAGDMTDLQLPKAGLQCLAYAPTPNKPAGTGQWVLGGPIVSSTSGVYARNSTNTEFTGSWHELTWSSCTTPQQCSCRCIALCPQGVPSYYIMPALLPQGENANYIMTLLKDEKEAIWASPSASNIEFKNGASINIGNAGTPSDPIYEISYNGPASTKVESGEGITVTSSGTPEEPKYSVTLTGGTDSTSVKSGSGIKVESTGTAESPEYTVSYDGPAPTTVDSSDGIQVTSSGTADSPKYTIGYNGPVPTQVQAGQGMNVIDSGSASGSAYTLSTNMADSSNITVDTTTDSTKHNIKPNITGITSIEGGCKLNIGAEGLNISTGNYSYTLPNSTPAQGTYLGMGDTELDWQQGFGPTVIEGGNDIIVTSTVESYSNGNDSSKYIISFDAEGKDVTVGSLYGTSNMEMEIKGAMNKNVTVNTQGTGNLILAGNQYPKDSGSNGQVLSTDGAGTISWVDPTEPAPENTTITAGTGISVTGSPTNDGATHNYEISYSGPSATQVTSGNDIVVQNTGTYQSPSYSIAYSGVSSLPSTKTYGPSPTGQPVSVCVPWCASDSTSGRWTVFGQMVNFSIKVHLGNFGGEPGTLLQIKFPTGDNGNSTGPTPHDPAGSNGWGVDTNDWPPVDWITVNDNNYVAHGEVEVQGTNGAGVELDHPLIWRLSGNSTKFDIGYKDNAGKFVAYPPITPYSSGVNSSPLGYGNVLVLSGNYLRESNIPI